MVNTWKRSSMPQPSRLGGMSCLTRYTLCTRKAINVFSCSFKCVLWSWVYKGWNNQLLNINPPPKVRPIFDKCSGGQTYWIISALLVLDNHSMPEQPHAKNTSYHHLSFNAVKVYKTTISVHFCTSDYCLYFQRSPGFKIFLRASLWMMERPSTQNTVLQKRLYW